VWPRARTADDATFKLGFVALDRLVQVDIVKVTMVARWLMASGNAEQLAGRIIKKHLGVARYDFSGGRCANCVTP
jgi:hypothetical protein